MWVRAGQGDKESTDVTIAEEEQEVKTIGEMTAEVREVNIALGWRTGGNTFGDYIALLHSEVAEALEAYRDHRLIDATTRYYGEERHPETGRQTKPEGVGSEFADVLIRLLDTCDVFGLHPFDPDAKLRDVGIGVTGMPDGPHLLESFGDWMAWLHRCIDRFWGTRDGPGMLRALVTVASRFGFNLDAEYARKVAFNRTREYQHGGRTLSDAEASA